MDGWMDVVDNSTPLWNTRMAVLLVSPLLSSPSPIPSFSLSPPNSRTVSVSCLSPSSTLSDAGLVWSGLVFCSVLSLFPIVLCLLVFFGLSFPRSLCLSVSPGQIDRPRVAFLDGLNVQRPPVPEISPEAL